MTFDDEAKDACDFIQGFISNAQLRALDRFSHALERIANLPWWKSWRAQQMAEEVLGWGPYWSKGQDPDTSPKSLVEYYRRWFRWKLLGGSR